MERAPPVKTATDPVSFVPSLGLSDQWPQVHPVSIWVRPLLHTLRIPLGELPRLLPLFLACLGEFPVSRSVCSSEMRGLPFIISTFGVVSSSNGFAISASNSSSLSFFRILVHRIGSTASRSRVRFSDSGRTAHGRSAAVRLKALSSSFPMPAEVIQLPT